MNLDDDAEMEARLRQLRPADAPPDLLRRLRAVEPAERAPWRLWPVAYAGLSAVWAVIIALWVLTPATPEAVAAPAVSVQAGPIPTGAPVFAATFLFARNNSDSL